MKKYFRLSVYQISLSGFMCALGIVLGVYGTFYIGGGGVYLIGIVLFLMPLVLKLPALILSTLITVITADGMTGYIAYTWISCAAYLSATLIIWSFNIMFKLKFIYLISTFISSLVVVAVFYFFSMAIPWFSHARIISDVISTSIEVTAAFLVSGVLYLPFKLIPKGN